MTRTFFIAGLIAVALSSFVRAQAGGVVNTGNVTSVAGGKITLALSDGGTLTFSSSDLAPGAKILLGGQPKQLTDIKVGTHLSVQVGSDFAIHAISDGPLSAPAAPKAAPRPPAAAASPKPAASTQWNSPSVNGKVHWWSGVVTERGTEGDGAQMTMSFVLTRAGGTETHTFHPDAATKFYVIADGKSVPATFKDITLNETVSAAVEDGRLLQATVHRQP
jgi:hypothetical protein